MKGKLKNYWVLCGFLFMCIRILYICTDTEIDGMYDWSKETESVQMQQSDFSSVQQTFQTDHKKLNSIELLFTGLPETKEGKLLLQIHAGKRLIYQTGISLERVNNDEWHQVYLNLPLHKEQIYIMTLAKQEAASVASICLMDSGTPEESIRCMIDGAERTGQLALRYGYLKTYSMADKLLRCMFSILAFLVFLLLVNHVECIRTRAGLWMKECIGMRSRWSAAVYFLECIFCFVLIEDCGMQMQASVKTALYLLSVLSCYGLFEKIDSLRELMRQRCAKVGLIGLDLYGAFALVGNRLFVYPLDKHVEIWDAARFAAVSIWFFPVLVTVLDICVRIHRSICQSSGRNLEDLRQTDRDGVSKSHRKGCWTDLKFAGIAAVLLIVPTVIALYAFQPAISSWDTGLCMSSARQIKGMQNWHPPIYVCFLKAILMVWDSPYAVVIVQIFFWAYVMLEGIMYLRRMGWKEPVLIVLTILTACNPANYLHVCTIWKDVPYGLAVLWLTIILARLAAEEKSSDGMFIYLELVAALFIMGMFRQNGIVPYILTAAALAVVFYKNRRLLSAVAVSVILVVGVKGPLYHSMDIQPMQKGSAYVGLGQDILGVYYAGGDLSDDTMSMAMYMTQGNLAENEFRFSYAAFLPVDISATGFIRNYLDTFIRNPVIMLRAAICRQDTIMNIFDGQDSALGCVNYTGTAESAPDWAEFWTDHYPIRQDNAFTSKIRVLTTYSAENQLTRILGWRAGFMGLLLLIELFFAGITCENKKFFLIFLPAAGNILSLFLASGWNEFRFYWPVNLAAVFICACIPALRRKRCREKYKNRK